MKEYQLYATMGAGFESVVNKELQSMGYVLKMVVSFLRVVKKI